MKFLRRMFRKQEARRCEDPVFGLITHSTGIWEHLPKRVADDFMITIEAPESGPSDLQRECFQKLRPEISNLERQARRFITTEAAEDVDADTLSVYSVELGTDAVCMNDCFVMELADTDQIVIHRVSFQSGRPTRYTYDT
jgi:hypothetical protein